MFERLAAICEASRQSSNPFSITVYGLEKDRRITGNLIIKVENFKDAITNFHLIQQSKSINVLLV